MKQNSGNKTIVFSELGKVPPQSIEMEEAVLGSIMVDKEVIYNIIDFLKPESFYKDIHQKIFNSMIDLMKKGHPVDLITVTEELRSYDELENVGGPVYLTSLTSKIVSTVNIEYYARVITQKYIQRELIRISAEIQGRAFDDSNDISELLEYAEMNLMEISGTLQKRKPQKLKLIINNIKEVISKIISGEIRLIGVPSGFTSLDRATGGFKEQEFIIIACRPSIGKTSLALQIAKNCAKLNYPVGIFSCEMSNAELGRRYLSGASGRTNTELINGKCDLEQISEASKTIINLPIYIDDTSGITVIELKAKTRKLIADNNIKMIIVDYLQLMKGEGQTREQEVSSISRGLKGIAKDLNIPVIALSQLNRRLENTANKKPNLSDLRESGSLEQDSDIVLFPHRPAFYGEKTIFINNVEEDTKGLMMLILAKNRNGVSGIGKYKHH